MKIDLSNKAIEKNNNLNSLNKKMNEYKNVIIESNFKKVEKNKTDKLYFLKHKRFIPFLVSNIILIFIVILLSVFYAFIVKNSVEVIEVSSVITSVMSFLVLIFIGWDLFFIINKSDLEIQDGLDKTKYSIQRILSMTALIAIFFIFIFNVACSISIFAFKENMINDFLNSMKITLSVFCWFSIIFAITCIATNVISFFLKD